MSLGSGLLPHVCGVGFLECDNQLSGVDTADNAVGQCAKAPAAVGGPDLRSTSWKLPATRRAAYNGGRTRTATPGLRCTIWLRE
jgi:hypothetical protein